MQYFKKRQANGPVEGEYLTFNLRQSCEGPLNKPEDANMRTPLINPNYQVLSTDTLKNFDRRSQFRHHTAEDEEAFEVQNVRKYRGTVSIKRGLDASSCTKTNSTSTFTEFILNKARRREGSLSKKL